MKIEDRKKSYDKIQASKDLPRIVVDTSKQTDAPIIQDKHFHMVFNKPWNKGDIITYDPWYGEQVVVAFDLEVEKIKEGYLHHVFLPKKPLDHRTWFPKDKLQKGIVYVKVGTAIPGSTDICNCKTPAVGGGDPRECLRCKKKFYVSPM
jgi:hypothetical protein